jgi:hypothetical protein
MVAGMLAAAAMPKQTNNNPQVTIANGNPMPTCAPGDGCEPPIPPR